MTDALQILAAIAFWIVVAVAWGMFVDHHRPRGRR